MTVAEPTDEIHCDAFVDAITVSIDRHVAKISIRCDFTEPTSEVMPGAVTGFQAGDHR